MSNTTTTTMTIKPGDIWRALWGIEQTNVDFYEVTRTTATMVTLTPIGQRDEHDGNMGGHTVPIVGKYTGKPVRRRVKWYGGEPYAYLSDYEIARPWNGKPAYFTTYA